MFNFNIFFVNRKGWIPASYADSVSTVQHFLLSAVMDALESKIH